MFYIPYELASPSLYTEHKLNVGVNQNVYNVQGTGYLEKWLFRIWNHKLDDIYLSESLKYEALLCNQNLSLYKINDFYIF